MVKTNLEILLIDTGIMTISQKDIPTLPANQTTGMLIHEAVEMLKRVNETLNTRLARMKELAKSLLEYPVVRAMDSSVGGLRYRAGWLIMSGYMLVTMIATFYVYRKKLTRIII